MRRGGERDGRREDEEERERGREGGKERMHCVCERKRERLLTTL